MTKEKSVVLEEFDSAREECRQPRCPYCGAKLKVRQTQYEFLSWVWNEGKKCYEKVESGDADPPECAECGAADWDFVDEDLIAF